MTNYGEGYRKHYAAVCPVFYVDRVVTRRRYGYEAARTVGRYLYGTLQQSLVNHGLRDGKSGK